jgi:outer membrane protein assembly factor BamB
MMRRLMPIVLVAGVVALGGCDWMKNRTTKRENIAPPKPLVEFAPTLSVSESWSTGVGKGAGKTGVRMRPAAADGRLYAASIDGKLVAIDADSGRTLWREDLEHRLSGGPAVSGDLVAVGSLDGDVIGVDATTGAPRWTTRVSSEVISSPIIGDGLVVVRCNDGRLYGLDVADGKQKWVYDRATVPLLSLRGNASPVMAGGVIYNGSDNGRIGALRASDGSPVWEQMISTGEGRTEVERLNDADGTVIVDGDAVYAAGYRGQVAALSATTGRPLWTRPLSSYTGVDASTSQVFAVDAESVVWSLDRTSGASMWKQDALQNRWLSPPAVQGNYVVVGDLEGYVHWLAIADGAPAARERLSKNPIQARPVVIGDLVVVADINGNVGAYRAAP